jgi:hypothetical protein
MIKRLFLLTTARSPDGVIFGYTKESELFCHLEFKQQPNEEIITWIMGRVPTTLEGFKEWAKNYPGGCSVVEMDFKITFQMFWDKYNDKERSSKKRSERLWDKLSEDNQVRAYYFYDTYNKKRGNAEKKYCETYLSAEQWNN